MGQGKIFNSKYPYRMNHLKWPFNEGSAAMTFYSKNDEIFKVNGIYSLSEHNDLDKVTQRGSQEGGWVA